MNFVAFFGGFLDTSSYALWVTPQFLAKWKVSGRYISVVSFMNIAFVVVKLWMFKHFSTSKKIPFLGAFSWFFGHNSLKFGQIFLKFGTAIKVNIMHHIYYGFWHSPENSKKLTQKPHFVVGFQKFLDHTLSPYGWRPNFGANERSHGDT